MEPVLSTIFGNSGPREMTSLLLSPEIRLRTAVLTGPSHVGKHSFLKSLVDSLVPEPDALHADVSMDGVREAVEFLGTRPLYGAYKAVVLDDADLLSEPAQDALLKLAEEPPGDGRIFLVTSDVGLLLPPLRNRLDKQIFWSSLSDEEMRQFVGSSMNMDEKALFLSRGRPGLYKSVLENPPLMRLHESCLRAISFPDEVLVARVPEALSSLKSGRSLERDSLCHVVASAARQAARDPVLLPRSIRFLQLASNLSRVPSLNAEIHWQRACFGPP